MDKLIRLISIIKVFFTFQNQIPKGNCMLKGKIYQQIRDSDFKNFPIWAIQVIPRGSFLVPLLPSEYFSGFSVLFTKIYVY